MKHVHTFESFLNEELINEATSEGIYWSPDSSLYADAKGVIYGIPAPMGRSPFSSAGLYCANGEVVGFYNSNGRIVYDLGVKCDQNTWMKVGPAIAEELNKIQQDNPKALVGFAGKKKPNAGPLKTIVEVLKNHIK